MGKEVSDNCNWDPNGAIITSETAVARDMYAGGTLPGSFAAATALATKDYTLSQYGQLWASGNEGLAAGSGINAPSSEYQQVQWAYKCIRALADTCASIPIRLAVADRADQRSLTYGEKSFRPQIRPSRRRTLRAIRGAKGVCIGRAAEGEIISAGEAYGLLERPNTYQDWPKFIGATIGYLYCRGKVAWVATGLRGLRPTELHVIDGKSISPVWSRDADTGMPILEGYKYRQPKTGAEIPLATDEVKYWSMWDDSDDPLGGMSPASPGKLALATEYNASLYNAYSLVNGCEPGLKITFPGTLTPEQRDQYRVSLQQRHQGAARVGKPLILEQGASAEPLTNTLKDMAWDALKGCTRLEICALYNVPPVVAGWVEAAGDSSAYTENSLKQFYQQAIFPLLDSLLPAVQEIVSRFDVRQVAYFDVEDQPVVQQMREARIDSAEKLFKMGRPWGDINKLLDLGLPQREWDEEGFLPASFRTVKEIREGLVMPALDEGVSDNGLSGIDDDEEDAAADDDDDKTIDSYIEKTVADRIWREVRDSQAAPAKKLAGMMRTRFYVQQRQVVKLLDEFLPPPPPPPSPADQQQDQQRAVTTRKDADVVARILFDVFGINSERPKFAARVRDVAATVYKTGIGQAIAEAGIEGPTAATMGEGLYHNPRITAAMQSDAVRISTKLDAFTRRHLRRSLTEGMTAGEDVKTLADRVQTFMGNRRKAALTVARNAVGQSLSVARQEGRQAAGVTHELWLHSRGVGDRRPAHVAAEAYYAAHPKPIGDVWIIGEARLRYPRDPAGPPAEVINCQCLVIGKRIASGSGKDAAVGQGGRDLSASASVSASESDASSADGRVLV